MSSYRFSRLQTVCYSTTMYVGILVLLRCECMVLIATMGSSCMDNNCTDITILNFIQVSDYKENHHVLKKGGT